MGTDHGETLLQRYEREVRQEAQSCCWRCPYCDKTYPYDGPVPSCCGEVHCEIVVTAECDCCGQRVPKDELVAFSAYDDNNPSGSDGVACDGCRGGGL